MSDRDNRRKTSRRERGSGSRSRWLNTPGFWTSLVVVILLVGYVQVIVASQPHPTGQKLDFTAFTNLAENGGIQRARILDQDAYVEGTFRRRGGRPTDFNTPYLSTGTRIELLEILSENQVPFEIDQQRAKMVLGYLSFVLPSLLLIVVFIYFIISYRAGSGIFATRSGARRSEESDVKLTFDDVAGQEQAVIELRELADFISDPTRFQKLGARVPKGVLLYGPPGCGKTLLARAVAGESGASFFSISGADFVEMYVGVGAARVRELFKDARENAPAIVFIDEIDAVARMRRSGPAASGGSSEEQGQALNQLLTEMDGFSPVDGTLVIAATNRPDDLDQALLRPGRFDRSISVDRPNEAGRAEILAVHARGKPLAGDVDLREVARRAIGLTGADLESVMNEAALLAARAGRDDISQRELEDALARILETPERQRRLSMRDRSVGQQTLDTERVTFADVAGVGEALDELVEIRDFLIDPTRYEDIGARFPRGFLLVGPPGVGKTLLARAVAGESNAAFLSVAATEFTEVFVGEGAARVRDLFARARAVAPTIVFIDEIDAIGASREAGPGDNSREREQTLNQILIELDGFRQRDGVIVMAATNRAEILDPALVRAGRFDRQITLRAPDRAGRVEILKVHVGSKRLAPDVDLDAIAGITRGLAGADLANVMNEAALLSARRGQREISMATLEEAVDRATYGISRAHVLTDEERRVVAIHEAGHAIVARAVPHGRLPHMISIIPSGDNVTGLAWMIDTHDRVVESRSLLIDEMALRLGGRCAEQLTFGEVGTLAGHDLAEVGRIAHQMVREFGMSDAVGPIGYPEDGVGPTFSDETGRLIDLEVRRLVDEAAQRAESVLRSSRPALERVAAALVESETLAADRIDELIGPLQPVATPARLG